MSRDRRETSAADTAPGARPATAATAATTSEHAATSCAPAPRAPAPPPAPTTSESTPTRRPADDPPAPPAPGPPVAPVHRPPVAPDPPGGDRMSPRHGLEHRPRGLRAWWHRRTTPVAAATVYAAADTPTGLLVDTVAHYTDAGKPVHLVLTAPTGHRNPTTVTYHGLTPPRRADVRYQGGIAAGVPRDELRAIIATYRMAATPYDVIVHGTVTDTYGPGGAR